MKKLEFYSEGGILIRGKYHSFPFNRAINNSSSLDIILIHAFPFDSDMFLENFKDEAFLNNMNDLALRWGDMRIFLPDLPGFGSSEAFNSKPQNLEPYVEVIHKLVEEYGIKRLIVGGCSMGGYITLEYANQHPFNLHGIILIDTRPTADTEGQKTNRLEIIKKLQETSISLGNNNQKIADFYSYSEVRTFIQNLYSKIGSPQVVQKKTKKGKKILKLMNRQSIIGIIHALRAMAGRHDNSRVLKDFMGKTLIFVGEQDQITPIKTAKQMKEIAKSAELEIIPNAGHLSNFEQPSEFNKPLFDWISSLIK